MTVEQALKTALAAHAGLLALIAGRVYPGRLPQTPTLPACTYQRIDTPTEQVMGEATVKRRPRMQITSLASTYDEAKAIAAQAVACLDGFSGLLGGAGGVQCDCIILANEADLYDDEAGRWQIVTDFEVVY